MEIKFSEPGVQRCQICSKEIQSGPMSELKVVRAPSTKRIVPWNSTAQIQSYAALVGCKPVAHKKTNSPTADKSARKVWGRQHSEFALVDQLKHAVT